MDIQLTVSTNKHGDCVVLVVGEIDSYTAPRLRELVCNELLNEREVVALDLAHVRYIDSTGLGVMVGIHNAVTSGRSRCHTFYLIDTMPRLLRRTFRSSGLDRKFSIGRPTQPARPAQSELAPA